MLTCLLYISTVINCTLLTVNQGLPLRMSYCGNHFGANCNFSCTIGHRLNGSSALTCVAPGNKPPGYWDNPLPSCVGTWKRIYIWNTHCIPNALNWQVIIASSYGCCWFSCHKIIQCWLSPCREQIKASCPSEYLESDYFIALLYQKLLTYNSFPMHLLRLIVLPNVFIYSHILCLYCSYCSCQMPVTSSSNRWC